MRGSMSVSLKIFFRTILYLATYAILLVLSNLFLIQMYNAANYLAEYHVACLRLGIVGYIVFSFLSYEYTNLPRACSLQEVLESIPMSKANIVFSQSIILLSLLFVWCCNVFGWILGKYMQSGISYPQFFFNAVPSLILDFFLPGVIAVLLGVILSQKAVREVAYCIIIISALLCSPVPSKIFAGESIFGHSILSLFDWFSILAPNTNWVADDIYGVSIEAYRWALAAFWILLLIATIIFIVTEGRKKFKILASVCAALALICCVRFTLRSNDSIIRKDYRPNGTLQYEYTYRQNNPKQEELPADFTVSQYYINLTVRSNTKANVIIELEPNSLREFHFTLYHGYNIDSVRDENECELEFDRDGDYVTIYSTEGTQKLNFEYSGTSGKYFANYQGIALPGYLPYYPVPGFIKVWESGQIVANTDRPATNYEVYVDSDLAVASNLKKSGHNTFSGKAEGVSLYAGMIVSEEINNVTYWYSPIGSHSIDIDDYQESWDRLSKQVGETSAFDLTGKAIFSQPVTIMVSNSTQVGYVEFSDHIITASWSVTADQLCQQHLLSTMRQDENTSLLYNAFSDYLMYGGDEEAPEISWSSIEILSRYNSADEIQDLNEWANYIEASNRFYELFSYKANLLGDDYVLKSVYQYLKSPSSDYNQVEFLYNLGE